MLNYPGPDNQPALHRCSIETPVGRLTLVAGEEGLRSITWPGESPAGLTPNENPAFPVLVQACAQLVEYFDGTRNTFDVPLAPAGTAFQLRAWEALRAIPYGEVRTYAEQAAILGNAAAVRAVGAANGRNPLPIVVPCHRVVGSNGSLTGFAGGLAAKRWLLDHERAHFPRPGVTRPLWPAG